LHQHPFAAYRWKTLIALYERHLPFTSVLVEAHAGLPARAAPFAADRLVLVG
jgi:glutathione S-transferase